LGKIVYQKNALVVTQDPATLKDYIKQMYRWNTGAWQIGMKYRMLTGRSRIDWEYKLLMGEGLLFGAVFILLPMWAVISPRIALYGMAMDSTVLMFLALLCGIFDRRADVVLASPLYGFVRFVDCSVFLYSFWNTIVKRKRIRGWFAVK